MIATTAPMILICSSVSRDIVLFLAPLPAAGHCAAAYRAELGRYAGAAARRHAGAAAHAPASATTGIGGAARNGLNERQCNREVVAGGARRAHSRGLLVSGAESAAEPGGA